MEKKPIIGIDMGIDPEYLESVVKQTVSASISEALLGKEELANSLIRNVLEREVNPSTGKVSQYPRDNTVPFIDHLVTKAVQETAEEIVHEELENMKGPVRDMLRETLAAKKTQSAMCDALMDCMDRHIKSIWGVKVNVEFSKNDD